MTIAEYIRDTEKLSGFKDKDGRSLQDKMLETTHIWTNAACSGYCALAMTAAGFSDEDTARVLQALESVMRLFRLNRQKCPRKISDRL